jgi:hypothetical protein
LRSLHLRSLHLRHLELELAGCRSAFVEVAAELSLILSAVSKFVLELLALSFSEIRVAYFLVLLLKCREQSLMELPGTIGRFLYSQSAPLLDQIGIAIPRLLYGQLSLKARRLGINARPYRTASPCSLGKVGGDLAELLLESLTLLFGFFALPLVFLRFFHKLSQLSVNLPLNFFNLSQFSSKLFPPALSLFQSGSLQLLQLLGWPRRNTFQLEIQASELAFFALLFAHRAFFLALCKPHSNTVAVVDMAARECTYGRFKEVIVADDAAVAIFRHPSFLVPSASLLMTTTTLRNEE